MPVLAKLWIDRDTLLAMTKEALVDELVKARQLAYERGLTIEQLRADNPNDWYDNGQPYPYIPSDGGS